MPAAFGNDWVLIEHTRDWVRSTGSDKRPSSILNALTEEEALQQHKLLGHYCRQKCELERNCRVQQTSIEHASTFSQPRRSLKRSPSTTLVRVTRTPTLSSAPVMVFNSVTSVPLSPSLPPILSGCRRKHTISHAQPAIVFQPPFRSNIEPTYEKAEAGFLGVAAIGTGPSMSIPRIPQYCLFPVHQVPVEPPLKSLPLAVLRPLRLLSLDGGGVRGISSLRILKVIMDRISPGARPCDYFDLIAGTSTGGLIAIMLGRLRMSVDDCIEQYYHLAKKIFDRHPAMQFGSLVTGEHRFSPANLEEAIKNVVEKTTPSNSKMADHHPRCVRTFVLAVKKHNVNNHAARRIRTYTTKTAPADTCEIWEAGRATSAAPSYFPSIKIPDERGQPCSYVDGALGYNNPSKELLNEARDVFGPEHSVGCFISIGTGRDKNVSLSNVRKFSSAYQAFGAIALSSEQVHWDLEQYFSGNPNVYFRFNAGTRSIDASGDEDFVQAVNMEDWDKMPQVEALTEEYLTRKDIEVNVSKCARRLASISWT